MVGSGSAGAGFASAGSSGAGSAETGADQRNFAMLVGFALFQTWVTLCFFAPQLFPETVDANRVYEVSLAVSAAVLVAGALCHRRLDRWLQSAPLLWALAVCAAVGTVIVPFCFGTAPRVVALTLIASVLTGVANGLLNVAWCRAFVHRGNAVDFALSVVTSSVIIYVLTSLAYTPAVHPYVMLAIAILVPLVSVALLCLGGAGEKGASAKGAGISGASKTVEGDFVAGAETAGMGVPVSIRQRRLFLVQLCVGVFVVSLTDEFMRNYYLGGTDLSFYSSQINLLILVFKVIVSVMVVAAISRTRHEDFSFLYRASFMLALIAALLLPFAQTAGAVGYAIANAGAFLFKLTVLLVSLEFCAQGAPATFTFCIIRAVWSLDLLLGYGLFELNASLPNGGADPAVLTVGFVVLVAFAYLFVFSPDGHRSGNVLAFGRTSADGHSESDRADSRDQGPTGANGTTRTPLEPGESLPAQPATGAAASSRTDAPGEVRGDPQPDSAPAPTGASALDVVCDRLAAQSGLSAREADVLRLLARGRTTTRIQDELHISMNTVNTHVRHVFQKLGVHSRQELLDLVEREAG